LITGAADLPKPFEFQEITMNAFNTAKLSGPTPASPLSVPAAQAQTKAKASRRVVDAPTRMFHWLFALCFAGAYITADGESLRLLHVTLGYTLAGLLGFRLVYGLVGPRHARLSLMARKLAGLPVWLTSFKAGSMLQVNWRQGQNLLMALAVVALLLLVLPVTLTGYLNYKDFGGDLMEELHGAAGELFLWVVLAHLALIAGLSALRNKNQALPMLTGRTEGAGPDLVKHNARWLGLLVLLSVLAYWVWAWQQSAQMLAS
jgi:cytochrome b